MPAIYVFFCHIAIAAADDVCYNEPAVFISDKMIQDGRNENDAEYRDFSF
jgi:hypothetical protein